LAGQTKINQKPRLKQKEVLANHIIEELKMIAAAGIVIVCQLAAGGWGRSNFARSRM
jgi:hypothetical protein